MNLYALNVTCGNSYNGCAMFFATMVDVIMHNFVQKKNQNMMKKT